MTDAKNKKAKEQTIIEGETAEQAAAKEARRSIYECASGLLISDAKFLPLPYLAIAVPQLLEAYSPSIDTSYNLGIWLIQQFLNLSFLYLVSARALSRLRPVPFSLGAFLRVQLYGFLIWFMFISPMVLSSATASLYLVSLVLMVGGAIFYLKYFFYFVPLVLGIRNPKQVFENAADLGSSDQHLPLKTMVAPAAIFLLMVAIARLPAPDGRYLSFSILEALLAGTFWMLSTYTALGAALTYLPRKAIPDVPPSAITAVRAQSRAWMSTLLAPKAGLKMLVVSLFFWSANFMRLMSMPPATSISVRSIEIQGKTIRLDLYLSDPEFHYRGFQPLYFALAGEKRSVIAPWPHSAKVELYEGDVMFSFPIDHRDLLLRAEFDATESTRSGAALKELEDLYLWYKQTKVAKLDMRSAKLIDSPTDSPTGVPDAAADEPAGPQP